MHVRSERLCRELPTILKKIETSAFSGPLFPCTMAARAANDRPPPSTAPYIPPQISTQDPLLAARISLPPNTIISYAILKPTMSASVHTLEQARRSLLSSSPIQESTLTSVQVGYDPCIYIFKLAQLPASPGILGHLNFDGLVGVLHPSPSTSEIFLIQSHSARTIIVLSPKHLLVCPLSITSSCVSYPFLVHFLIPTNEFLSPTSTTPCGLV